MTYLVASFVVVWVLVLVYVLYMAQRQRNLEQDLRSLEEAIAEKGKQARKS